MKGTSLKKTILCQYLSYVCDHVILIHVDIHVVCQRALNESIIARFALSVWPFYIFSTLLYINVHMAMFPLGSMAFCVLNEINCSNCSWPYTYCKTNTMTNVLPDPFAFINSAYQYD